MLTYKIEPLEAHYKFYKIIAVAQRVRIEGVGVMFMAKKLQSRVFLVETAAL